jgi:acetyltransferase
MAALVRYNDIRNRKIGGIRVFEDVSRTKAVEIVQKAKSEKREFLSQADVSDILTAYKIPVAEWKRVQTAAQAVDAADAIGYPVVIKADAESIIHKSDVGGVALNLENSGAVQSVVEKMTRDLDAAELRFFVQKFLPQGLEMIIGAKIEEGLGHTVMFGLGGIYVEVLKDVVFNLTPVTDVEARDMMDAIKGAALLNGVRGQKGIDKKALEEVILRVSQLVSDLPEIVEMDLNPVIGYKEGVFVADARIGI